jgi:hypothetical protein
MRNIKSGTIDSDNTLDTNCAYCTKHNFIVAESLGWKYECVRCGRVNILSSQIKSVKVEDADTIRDDWETILSLKRADLASVIGQLREIYDSIQLKKN